MKPRYILMVLVVAVAALGFQAAQSEAALAAADGEIAVLNKKLATAQREAVIARSQSARFETVAASGPVEPVKSEAATEKPGVEAEKPAPMDPRALLALAEGLPPGAERTRAMQAALRALAATDPEAAWAYAQNLAEDSSDNRTERLKDVLRGWSINDPAKAAAMLATLPPALAAESSDVVSNTTGVIESNWLKKDPQAASEWIKTLPAGNTRDSAIMALAAGVETDELPTAFDWVASMADYAKRGSTINKVVTQWAKTDPVAATAAVMARYPDNNNGRQAALLAIIERTAPNGPATAAMAGGGTKTP